MREIEGSSILSFFVKLIVIVSVIGFLFYIFKPIEMWQKFQDNERKKDLAIISEALEQYHKDTGYYPKNTADFKILRLDGTTADWGQSWIPYLDILPSDFGSRTYVYVADPISDGQTYYLYASLERGLDDPDACNRDGSACSHVPENVFCGSLGIICNYGITSSNTTP